MNEINLEVWIRTSPDTEPVKIDYARLIEKIKAGETGPLAEYRYYEVNPWETLDNLPDFHRHSPKPAPAGKRLAEHLKQVQLAQRLDAKRLAARDAYYTENLLQSYFQLSPIEEHHASDKTTLAVSRAILLPAFAMECVLTLEFHLHEVYVHAIQSNTPIVQSLSTLPLDETGKPTDGEVHEFIEAHKAGKYLSTHSKIGSDEVHIPFDLKQAREWKRVWPSRKFAKRFMSVEELLQLVSKAPSCSTEGTRDGMSIEHEFSYQARIWRAIWRNPNSKEHPAAKQLFSGYAQLFDTLKKEAPSK